VAPELLSAGPKLHLVWQRVDARPAPCLNLEFVYGVSGLQGTDMYNQRESFICLNIMVINIKIPIEIYFKLWSSTELV
jgi:hypothetical protein